jgi:3D (Asp-Asp-Asp) domain-containing protein
MKTNTKFNKAISAGLLAFTLLSLVASSANAMNLLGSNGNLSDSGVAFVSANNSITAFSQTSTPVSSVIIDDNSILAISNPSKDSKTVSSKNMTATGVSCKSQVVVDEIYIRITGYSSTPDQTDGSPFITADGTTVYDGLFAANFLNFGTQIEIPDYFGCKKFTNHDRMNKRYPSNIDIWFPNRQSALDFGSRILRVEILGS